MGRLNKKQAKNAFTFLTFLRSTRKPVGDVCIIIINVLYGFDGGDGGWSIASNLFYYVIVIITIIITEKNNKNDNKSAYGFRFTF